MYLKLENDDALFYNYESMDLKSKKAGFKFNPCHYTDREDPSITFCFEADITDDLRSFINQFDVDLKKNVAKIQFYLYQDGKIGPCS